MCRKGNGMFHEKSCGAIVYRKFHGNTEILLIKHVNSGHWSFPKGHVEAGETEIETAKREVMEETAIDVMIDPTFRETVTYSPKKDTLKVVVYFLAKAKNYDDICSRSLAEARLPMVAGVWQGTMDIKKGVYWRFVLGCLESSKFNIEVKDEATVDAHCGICIFARNGKDIFGVGFCVARSTSMGNARALSSGTGNNNRLPRFFLMPITKYHYKNAPVRELLD